MVEGTNLQKCNLFNLVQKMVQNTIAPVEQTIQARLRQITQRGQTWKLNQTGKVRKLVHRVTKTIWQGAGLSTGVKYTGNQPINRCENTGSNTQINQKQTKLW